ncbi:MAG: NTP transferase domain-containing protein [Planctomycetota bacterium]
MTLAVVVLAAGASRRLGEPKALARIGERTALEHLADAARAGIPDGPRPLVVAGAHQAEIAAHVTAAALDVEVVHNVDWALGRTGSVAAAATARAGLDLLVAPVDAPLVPDAVFATLVREWDTAESPATGWLAPATVRAADGGGVERRFGHPVVLGRKLARRTVSMPPDAPLRDVRGSAAPLLWVDVQSHAIHDDVDEPADLGALRRRAADG